MWSAPLSDLRCERAYRSEAGQQGKRPEGEAEGCVCESVDSQPSSGDACEHAAGKSPEDYFAEALSSKKRKELRRQLARLCEEGAVNFVRQADDEGLGKWTDRFLELEQAGWKGKAGSALAQQATTEALFRQSLVGAAAHGRLERLSLTLDGRPIAMLANFITAPGAFSFKTTYDEAYSRFSPGVLLQCENLLMLDRPDVAWTEDRKSTRLNSSHRH